MTYGRPPPSDPPPLVYAGPGAAEWDRSARLWATFAHLSGLLGLGVPFGHLIGPLVIWLVKRDVMPFVDEQGKEAVNFQITVTIALFVAAATFCVGIGVVVLPLVAVGSVVLVIVAAVKANGGEHYRYPVAIRFIR
jgi:uncharacterized Tic20 family protein